MCPDTFPGTSLPYLGPWFITRVCVLYLYKTRRITEALCVQELRCCYISALFHGNTHLALKESQGGNESGRMWRKRAVLLKTLWEAGLSSPGDSGEICPLSKELELVPSRLLCQARGASSALPPSSAGGIPQLLQTPFTSCPVRPGRDEEALPRKLLLLLECWLQKLAGVLLEPVLGR